MSSKSEFIERQKNQYFYEITSLGGNFIYAIVALVFLILGIYNIFSKLLFGILLIYAVVVLIKMLYFKNRPQKYNYNSFIEKIDASSFPSVHASRSAFLALILMGYFSNLGISILLGILVLMVVYSRINLKRHDIIDISAGIILGVLVYFIVNWLL